MVPTLDSYAYLPPFRARSPTGEFESGKNNMNHDIMDCCELEMPCIGKTTYAVVPHPKSPQLHTFSFDSDEIEDIVGHQECNLWLSHPCHGHGHI